MQKVRFRSVKELKWRTTAQCLRWHPIIYVGCRVRPESCSMARRVGECSGRSFGYPVRLGTIPNRCVKLNAFLLADILHLSHTQFARVVRHGFVHPFLGFTALNTSKASGTSNLSRRVTCTPHECSRSRSWTCIPFHQPISPALVR